MDETSLMEKKLKRSRTDRMISGVCGGIANYFNIDSTIIRAAFAVAAVIGVGAPILIYIVLIFVVPEEVE